MKQNEITTLRLLESLERDPKQTQRDLAKALNISLGLVNAFTKRLIQKGFFKLKTIPKNRVKYILTPKGMYEKTRLTYRYLTYSMEFYKESREKIRSIYDLLFEQGLKKIYLLGAGELAEIALISLQESKLELAGIIDNEKAGGELLGKPIMDCSCLKSITSDETVMITKIDSSMDFSGMVRAHNPEVHIIDLGKSGNQKPHF